MTSPRPTTVRLQMADGQVQELSCNQPWARLGESCAAMDAVKIFALDATGGILRVSKIADIAAADEEDLDDDDNRQHAPTRAQPRPLPVDPDAAILAVLDRFASHLADAYRHATTTAFEQVVQVATIHANTTAAMQRELMNARLETRRLERDMIDDAIERADAGGDGDMLRQFIGAYFSGQAERVVARATDAVAGAASSGAGGKPNGKPAPPPTPKGSA
jgi:hypothetical protein